MSNVLERTVGAAAISAVRKPLAEASLLPPVVYSSPEIFELERETVFARCWLPVCHVSQLPQAGSYVGRTVVNEPVLAVRDKDNQIQVYSNVCRHRNTTLALGEGTCRGARITCPYHGWTYGLDGRLLAAPFMDKATGFNRQDFGLLKLRSEIWHGLVFVNLDPDAAPLAPQLRGLEKYVAGYGMEDWVAVSMATIPAHWNWKVSLENFTEAYHQPWVHAATAEPVAPSKGARYYDNDGGLWSAFLIPNATPHSEAGSAAAPKGPPPGPDALPASIDEGALVFNIYPYFHSLATSNAILWLDLSIDSVGRHDLVWRVLFPKAAVADGTEGPLQEFKGFLQPVIQEDVGICTAVGIGTRSRLARAGRLSHMEKCVHQFHNWWLDGVQARSRRIE